MQLDARALVELARRDARDTLVDGVGATRVAVVDGVPQQRAVAVDQPEVDRPGVDGDRVDGRVARGRAEPVEHVAEEAVDVPAAATPSSVDRHVREAVHLFDGQPLAVEARRRRRGRSGRRGRRRPSSPSADLLVVPDGAAEVARAERRRLARPGVGGDHVDARRAPRLDLARPARPSR